MRLLKRTIFLVLALNLIQVCVGRTGLEVRTENGLVHGTTSISRLRREFYSWRGIPYAEPPVGKLRFQDPIPVRSWNGNLSAVKYGSACSQVYAGLLPIGKEDCLTLNVFAPADATDHKNPMPVMIFFHGGIFAMFSAPTFSPDYFMDEDVLLVTVNYRLDVFGFLSTGDGIVRGNMGLKDQSMAINWVRNNIEAFGGDRSRITIFGESAGAASVHFHILSPMSRGLFNGGISQSGTATTPWALDENPAAGAKKLGKDLGCPTKSSDELVDCLRTKSVGQILAIRFRSHLLNPIDLNQKSDYFLPVIEAVKDENAFLTEHPKTILEEGRSAKVPWLAGTNSAEGLLLAVPFVVNPRFRKRLDQNWDKIAPELLFAASVPNNGSNYQKIRQFYFGRRHLTSLSVMPEFTQMMTDRLFLVDFIKSINGHARIAPVYACYFTKNGPSPYRPLTRARSDSRYPSLIELARAQLQSWLDGIQNQQPESGVGHYDEMFMLTPLPNFYFVGEEHRYFEFSRDLVKLWVSFASGIKTLPFRGLEFAPLDPSENPVLFQMDDEPQHVNLDIDKRMALWNGFEGKWDTNTK